MLDELLQHPESDGWARLFAHFTAPLYAAARCYGLDHDETRDVVQESWLAFVESCRNGRYDRARGSALRWLLGIARNKAADAQRRKCRRRALVESGLDLASSRARDASVRADPQPEWWVEEQIRSRMERCIGQLAREVTPRTLAIFRELLSGGRSVEEVAARFRVPKSVVYNVWHRATRRLRALLASSE